MALPLPASFYDRDSADVARALLGAVLECRTAEGVASGRIVETEAYLGADDPASHAAPGPTNRNRDLFSPPATAYVYFVYGMYWCVNAVTAPVGLGAAVLVRAVEPLDGLAIMRRRRPRAKNDRALTNGPGKLCAAFGIDISFSGRPLTRPPLVIRAGREVSDSDVGVSARVGITKAADWPQRYYIRDNPWVSPGRVV